jgi:hypothetical protein
MLGTRSDHDEKKKREGRGSSRTHRNGKASFGPMVYFDSWQGFLKRKSRDQYQFNNNQQYKQEEREIR